MAPTHPRELDGTELYDVAWGFLRSEFAGRLYQDWPIDRRIDAYLVHYGTARFVNDGSAYDALLDCVMSNIGTALRTGVLPAPRS
jgi:uncharacterized protein YqjF (DUF2071 family)